MDTSTEIGKQFCERFIDLTRQFTGFYNRRDLRVILWLLPRQTFRWTPEVPREEFLIDVAALTADEGF